MNPADTSPRAAFRALMFYRHRLPSPEGSRRFASGVPEVRQRGARGSPAGTGGQAGGAGPDRIRALPHLRAAGVPAFSASSDSQAMSPTAASV